MKSLTSHPVTTACGLACALLVAVSTPAFAVLGDNAASVLLTRLY